jgi:hypothetical protein
LLVEPLGSCALRENLEDRFDGAKARERCAIHCHHRAYRISGGISQGDGDESFSVQPGEQLIGRETAPGIFAADEGFASDSDGRAWSSQIEGRTWRLAFGKSDECNNSLHGAGCELPDQHTISFERLRQVGGNQTKAVDATLSGNLRGDFPNRSFGISVRN